MKRDAWIGIAAAWMALGCAGDVMHEGEAIPSGEPLSGPCDAPAAVGVDCTAGACGETRYTPDTGHMCGGITVVAYESFGALVPPAADEGFTARAYNVWLKPGTCARVRVSPGAEVQLPDGTAAGSCAVYHAGAPMAYPVRAWMPHGDVAMSVVADVWPADSPETCPLVCE